MPGISSVTAQPNQLIERKPSQFLCKLDSKAKTATAPILCRHALLLLSPHRNQHEHVVKSFAATSMSQFFSPRQTVLRAIAALMCLLPVAMTHASEASDPAPRTKVIPNMVYWASISLGNVKDSLTWLRKTTTNGLLPKRNNSFSDAAMRQFDLERELFKSAHRSQLASLMQSGVAVGSNTQVHWDVERFWTADDDQDITVKVGLNVGFR
jgi:hypothetical protein